MELIPIKVHLYGCYLLLNQNYLKLVILPSEDEIPPEDENKKYKGNIILRNGVGWTTESESTAWKVNQEEFFLSEDKTLDACNAQT